MHPIGVLVVLSVYAVGCLSSSPGSPHGGVSGSEAGLTQWPLQLMSHTGTLVSRGMPAFVFVPREASNSVANRASIWQAMHLITLNATPPTLYGERGQW